MGNRLSDDKTAGAWGYNQNNELQGFDDTSFKYNLNGQMVEKTVAGVKTSYSYNLDGRLSEIKNNAGQIIATYQYDALRRRISKSLPQQSNKIIYFHYSKEGLIAEYDETGLLTQSYGYRPESQFTTDPVFTKRPDFSGKAKGGYVYYINDHIGTPKKLITETGRKVWESRSYAFGKTIISNNEFTNPLHFSGQYRDEESQFRYNFHRYYDAQLGRYITSDPIALIGGLNTYEYVYSNPITYYDPKGLYRLECNNPDDCNDNLKNKISDGIDKACRMVDNNVRSGVPSNVPGKLLKQCIKEKCAKNSDALVTCHNNYPVEGYWYPDDPDRIRIKSSDTPAYESPDKTYKHPARLTEDKGQTAIHEWAHSCGWNASSGPHPGPDNNDGIPLAKHPETWWW